MTIRCTDTGSFSRFAHGTADVELRLAVEQHILVCADCRKHLSLMQGFANNLFDELSLDNTGASTNSCPSPIQLRYFERENLAEGQMIRLQFHVDTCATCRSQLRQPLQSSSGAPQQAKRPMTCPADLVVRWTSEGLLLANGTSRLETSPQPTLVDLLHLPIRVVVNRRLRSSRILHFQLPHRGLRGRFCLHSPEAFSLRLEAEAANRQPLQLWTRHQAVAISAMRDDFWETSMLLPRGHYFVGPYVTKSPWLALSLEECFTTATELAWWGWDHCLHGRFYSAARCFGLWGTHDPNEAAAERCQQDCRLFAAEHGMQQRDRPLDLGKPASRQKFAQNYVIFLLRLQEFLPHLSQTQDSSTN